MQRIDQYLFSNIVKMSYQADKAHKMWLKEYAIRSEKERRGYTYFFSKTKRLQRLNYGNDDVEDNIELKIFNLWCGMNEEEQEKWINKADIINNLFMDVETFLRMFQHNM